MDELDRILQWQDKVVEFYKAWSCPRLPQRVEMVSFWKVLDNSLAWSLDHTQAHQLGAICPN